MEKDKLKELVIEKLGEQAYKDYYEAEGMGMPTSFAQLLENKQASEVAEQVYDLSNMFRMLAFNIACDGMLEDKVGTLQNLADEYIKLVQGATQKAKSNSLLDWIKELNPFKAKEAKQPNAEESPSFFVFKDKSGQLRWMAIHTNNYEDQDGHPEIIASFAHKEFVEAVEAGNWPYPELWVWHASPESSIGVADMLHYDEETGFMVSTGTVNKDKEHIAEGLAKYPQPLKVSHGMPKDQLIYAGGYSFKEVKHIPGQPAVIVRYRSREISPLPLGAEANKLTAFTILNGGTTNGIA